MSYIRATSNPEGLYVYGSGAGVEWYSRSRHLFTMPYDVFEIAVRQYVEEGEAVFLGLSIQTRVVDGNQLRVVLQWGDYEAVEMWEVTWDAIVSRAQHKPRARWFPRLFLRG